MNVTVYSVSIIDGNRLVNYWSNTMTMIKTSHGVFIDYGTNASAWGARVGETVKIRYEKSKSSYKWAHVM